MPFDIVVHEGDEIVEIIYPDAPTFQEVDDYIARVRQLIETRRRPWACLVDQRKLPVMPPRLADEMTALNAHAARHGMRCSARIVSTAIAELQASRMARDGTIGRPIRTFTRREDAVAWLRTTTAR